MQPSLSLLRFPQAAGSTDGERGREPAGYPPSGSPALSGHAPLARQPLLNTYTLALSSAAWGESLRGVQFHHVGRRVCEVRYLLITPMTAAFARCRCLCPALAIALPIALPIALALALA